MLALKADYKLATGTEWKPGCVPPQEAPPTSFGGSSAADINDKIVAQGDNVRDLKSKKAAKVGHLLSCWQLFHIKMKLQFYTLYKIITKGILLI